MLPICSFAQDEPISFADATVKSLCVAAWDTDGDGELSYGEAAAVTDLGSVFTGNTKIKSLDELQYFTSLHEIGADAFSGCQKLTSVVVPDSVVALGNNAFKTCYHLTSVVLPDTLSTIGASAFYACKALATLTLPSNVVSVGSNAFYYCLALESVVIPESVKSVSSNAFNKCTALTTVMMPAVLKTNFVPSTVTTLRLTYTPTAYVTTLCSPNVLDFGGCEGLDAYTVCGVSSGDACLMAMPVVPANTGVIVMGTAGTQYILSVGTAADGASTNLLVGVTADTEVSPAVADKLNFVVDFSEETPVFSPLSDKTVIAANTAYLPVVSSLVPESGVLGLRVVDSLPVQVIDFADANVKSLCVAAWDTDGDGELSYDEAAAVTDLGTVFKGNTKIKSFDELQYFTSLREIPADAFSGCQLLTSVVVPDSVTAIGNNAFKTCYHLTSVVLPDTLSTIGASAFYACKALTSMTLPSNVVSVGSNAFYYCLALESVVIPESVTSVSSNAFNKCTALTTVTMPAVLKTAFVPSTVTTLRLTYTPSAAVTTFCSPNNLDFSSCEGLEPYIASVKRQGDLYLYSVQNVPAGTGVVLNGTPGTQYVLALGAATSIDGDNLLKGVLTATTVEPQSNGGSNMVLDTESDPAVFTTIASATTIAANSAYLPQVTLGDDITTLTLNYDEPVHVDVIDFADANVKSLCVAAWDTDGDGELSYDEAAAVTDLGSVFKGNTKITSFDELQYFTSLHEIPADAFSGCQKLTSLIVPDSVTAIGNNAFKTCYHLTSVTLPDTLSTIGASAFYACKALTSMTLPSNVVSVGSNAFYYCLALESVVIPESVTSVSSNAFNKCTALTTVTMPAVLKATFVPSTVTTVNYTYTPATEASTLCSPNNLDFSSCEGLVPYIASIKRQGDLYLYSVQNVPAGTGVVVRGTPDTQYIIQKGEATAIDGDNLLAGVLTATTVEPQAGDGVNMILDTESDPAVFAAVTESTQIAANSAYLPQVALSEGETTLSLRYDEETPVEVIEFADAAVKSLCVAAWDTDGDGELSYEEAVAVTDLGSVFTGNTDITSFTELQYFTSLHEIGADAFAGCQNLAIVAITDSIESIGDNAFSDCQSIESIVIPESVTSFGNDVLSGCTGLVNATIPVTLSSSVLPSTTVTVNYLYTPASDVTTLCSPNDLDFGTCEGLVPYTASAYRKGDLYLFSTDSIPAATGIVVKGTAGTQYVIASGTGATIDTDNLLVGVLTVTAVEPQGEDGSNMVLDTAAEPAVFKTIADTTDVAANSAYLSQVTLASGYTKLSLKYDEEVPVEVIDFADANVKSLCVAAWDTDGDGELSYVEAAAVTDLGSVFTGNTKIKSFDELQYFTSLREIPADAFSGCKLLTTVVVPDSVVALGNNAFKSCYRLASVTLPDTLSSIGTYAFYACQVLPSITIPSNVTAIGAKTFYYCKTLGSIVIPESVKSVSNTAFDKCTALTTVTMPAVLKTTFVPSNVTTINFTYTPATEASTLCSPNNLDFSTCEGLVPYIASAQRKGDLYLYQVQNVPAGTGVVVNGTPGTQYIIGQGDDTAVDGENLLAGVLTATTVEPETEEGRNMVLDTAAEPAVFTSIEASAEVAAKTAYLSLPYKQWSDIDTLALHFDEPYPVENIVFADNNVKAICVANWDLNGDGEINYDEAEAVTDLGDVFKGNRTIKSFDELQYFTGITQIPDSAFKNCRALKSIILPESVAEIRPYAFYYCSGMTSIQLSENLTTIGTNAFSVCSTLPSIELPASVSKIGKRAFYYCLKLKSITLPEGLESIPAEMLRNCSALDSISIPLSVKTVGNLALYACSKLRAVRMSATLAVSSMPSSVTDFYYVYTLPEDWSTLCSPNALGFSTTDGVDAYVVDSYQDGTALLKAVDAVTAKAGVVLHGTAGAEVIFSKGAAEAVDNLLIGVTEQTAVPAVSDGNTNLFFRNDELSGIGFYPLDGTADLDANRAYLAIQGDDFGYDMAHVLIGDFIVFADDDVKALCVANWDTNGDGELSVAEAAAVTSIGNVFASNDAITTFDELKYFTGITQIPASAFAGCEALRSVYLPNNVTAIGASAFSSCDNLQKIQIPDGLTLMGDNAFDGCARLQAITIPEGMTTVGSSCFNGCASLTEMTIPETVVTVGDDAFVGCTSLASVTVPAVLAINNMPSSVTDYVFTYTLTAPYETFCSPWNLDFSATKGLQVFVSPQYSNGRLKMSLVDNASAGTGLVLHGTAGTQYRMTLGSDQAVSNLYVGVLEDTPLSPTMGDETIFCFYKGAHGYAFYPLSESTTLDANRAYLTLPTSEAGGVAYVLMSLLPDIDNPVVRAKDNSNGSASSIDGIDAADALDGEWYTISGVKLNDKPVQKGVYIHNGMKVSVK